MTPAVRTLALVERRSRRVRLAPDEVAFLLAHHRGHIDLAPTPQRHVWRIASRGVAGVLFTPRRRITIAPKVPLQTLLYLADPEAAALSAPDAATATDGGAFLDLFAGLLARLMMERGRAGLHRGYRQTATQGPFLVGALDVPAQLRQSPYRKDQLHGRLDDFTAELPCNQLPRRLAAVLLAHVQAVTRSALEQAILSFSEISEGPLTPDVLAPTLAPPGYEPLLDLCRLLADALALSPLGTTMAAPSVLVALERLFERHVTRTTLAAFADDPHHTIEVQPAHTITGPPDLTIRPDVVVRRAGEAVLVLDAKWKRLPRETLVSEDVYQLLAYGTILGCPQVALIYPGRRRSWRQDFAPAGIGLTVRTVDVGGDVAACREAGAKLGRAMRRLARGSGKGR